MEMQEIHYYPYRHDGNMPSIIQASSRAILGPGGDCEEVRGRGPEALGLGE